MPANGGGHSSVSGLMGFDGSQDGVREPAHAERLSTELKEAVAGAKKLLK
jgi:hypothetical protein